MAILTLTIPGVGDYDYDTSTTGIPGQRQDLRAIQSFNILANDAEDEWTLYVNTQIFIGRYATQAQAIGALFGCFIRAGADEVGLAAAMGNQINAGLSVITDDDDNIITQSIQGGEYVGTLRNFNSATFVPTSTVTVGAPTVILNGTPTALNGATSFSGNTPALYFSTNTFTVATAWTGPGILNAIELTPLTVPALSVNVSLPTAVPVVGQPYTASAALTNYDSRIPVKYKWTWFKVVSSTDTAVQGPDITTSATNTLLAANLTLDSTTYKAKVEMLYALDDTIITNADAEKTSSPSETTFAWTTSFPITNIGSTYTVAPVAGTNYVGSNVTLAYSWFKDGAAFGTNSASQVLTVAGTYTCDVAGSNVINGITYSGTMAASNSAIVVPLTNPLMAVSSEGWDTSLTMPGTITSGANPNFDFTKSAITVQRAGFTSAGVADTKTLTHSLTNTVRLAYPNQADKDTVNGSGTYTARTSMSDSIYSTDTVSATSTANFDSTGDAYTFDVTNNSTLGTANVIANWVTPIADFEHTDTLSVDVMAFHASATGGNMGIACVKFFAYKNGSATASYTSTVTTPTTTTASRTGIKYPVFRFTQDISSDAAGDSYRIKAEVYPVWGAMFSSEGDDTATYDITSKKRIINTNHFYDCLRWKETNDGTIPVMYVANAGNDATGNGTSALPYATIKRAKEQIFTNTSGYGGIIHVSGALGETAVALTVDWASLTALELWPTKIKGDGTAILYSGVSITGDKQIKGAPYLIIDNVTFDYANVSGNLTPTPNTPATGGWYTFWGNGSSSENTAPTRLMFNNCVFKNMTTTISNPNTTVYLDAVDHFGCVQDVTCTTDHFFNSGGVMLTGERRNSGILVGNKFNGSNVFASPNVYVGNSGAVNIDLLACSDFKGVWLTSTLERHRNNVIGAYNLVYNIVSTKGVNISTSTNFGSTGTVPAGDDIALVCNYGETLAGTHAIFHLNADGDNKPCNNYLIWHNTSINAKVNYIYNDTGYALKSDINIRGNMFMYSYIKSDTFDTIADPSGTRVGNWATMNGANAKYNSSSYFVAGANFEPDHRNDWYEDTDNTPLVLTSTPAMATRSRWDAPIGCVAGFESVVGFTYGAAESPIPILTDGTAATKLGAGVPSVVAPSAQDYTDYMASYPAVGYWEIPATTAGTGAVTGPTGGDGSTNWAEIIGGAAASFGPRTTQSGTPVPVPGGEWNRNVVGGYQQYSNAYNYMAISFGPTSGGTYGTANGPGWVILEREAVSGTASDQRQTYLCIEGTDGMTEATYAGGMPTWPGAGHQDSMVFFFNDYQAGDVKTWTDWDGTTTPGTYADWDTFHSGFVEYNPAFNNSYAWNIHVLQGDTTWQNSTSSISSPNVQQQFFNMSQGGQWYPPAIAQWYPTANGGAGEWRVGEYVSDSAHPTSTTVVYDIAPSGSVPVYTIYLNSVPESLPSTWRAYDGPVPADFSSPKFYPVATAGIAGTLAGFSSNQYNNTQLFDNLGMVQINTSIATNSITFFFHTVLARDEFKAFTDFTFGGTSFNPSANTDWAELNAGSNGFGIRYTDSAVCAAWTASMTSRNNTGNVTGSYIGTSTFATPAQTMTWTLGGVAGASWSNSGSVVSAVTGTEFLRPATSEVNTGPRLVNGAEANNFGATLYSFQPWPSGSYLSTEAQCRWYWQSLDVRTINSRIGTTIQRAPAYVSPQPAYNNAGNGNASNIVVGPNFTGWQGGDVVNFEIRDSSYSSNRIISFTFNGTDGYQPNQVTLQGQVWAGRSTTAAVSVNSTTAQNFSYYMANDGVRDGVLQWLSATLSSGSSNGLEIYDRDADVAYACTFATQSSSRIRVTMTTGSWVSGHRYELRYV